MVNEKAQTVERIQKENALKKGQIEAQLKEVARKNAEINEKIRLIKDKANTLSGNLPNDMILQVFVKELAEKVEQRKLELTRVLKQAKEVMEYEKKMAENISQLG